MRFPLFASLLGAGAALASLLFGCGSGESAGREVTDPRSAVLAPADLARGYRRGDDSGCGVPSAAEGGPPRLETLFREEQPDSCVNELERVWAAAGSPAGVTSAAYVFRDEGGARRGFVLWRDVLAFSAPVHARESRDAELGDEAKLVQGRGLNHPAAAVVWRSGNVVAVLATEPADERATRSLAAQQQRRIEGAEPPAPEVDEAELALDDPTLDLPVYWLGRTFDPGGSLPGLTLRESVNVLGSGPGNTLKLDYGAPGKPRAGVSLDLWPAAAWRSFRRTLLGRLVWDSPCARKTVTLVPVGRAEIFEGYGTPRPAQRPCPARRRDRTIAHVYADGVVVAIDMPYCYMCASGDGSPYETVPGMTTLSRGLRLRTR